MILDIDGVVRGVSGRMAVVDKVGRFKGIELDSPMITKSLKPIEVVLQAVQGEVIVIASRPDSNIICELGDFDVFSGRGDIIDVHNEKKGAEDRTLGNPGSRGVGGGPVPINLSEGGPVPKKVGKKSSKGGGEV